MGTSPVECGNRDDVRCASLDPASEEYGLGALVAGDICRLK